MKFRISEIRDICMNILLSKGLSKKDAETIFEEYLDGELRNRLSHGFSAFVKFGAKIIGETSEPKIIKETDSSIFIDGGNNLGQIVMRDYLPVLLSKAKKSGIAMIGISNMHSYLMPGTSARKATKEDMILLGFNYGGAPRVAPFGSIDPIFATNPISVGIPSNDFPIIIDMATSSIAMGKVRLAKKLSKNLPDGCCIDRDGNATIDPDEAIEGALFPFGGYKGAAIGLMVEILTRTMFDIEFGNKKRGFLFICIDPSFFGDIGKFKKNVSELIRKIKSSRKADGTDEIFVPGERSEKIKQENLKECYLEIDDRIIDEIKSLL